MLYHKADIALYQAIAQGKNGYTIFQNTRMDDTPAAL